MIIDNTTAGPAWAAAARPVSTKIPVPMMAPMPSRVRSTAVSERLRPWWPSASARSWSTDFVANRGFLLGGIAFLLGRRVEHGERSVEDDHDHEPFHPGKRQALHDETGDQRRRH